MKNPIHFLLNIVLEMIEQICVSVKMDILLHSKLRPNTLFFFLIKIIFVVVPTPVSAINYHYQYLNCSRQFHCANLQNIGYPFWGGDRPEYCGYPGFKLGCEGEKPVMTMKDITYRILNIDNQSQTITAARGDYWGDICPSSLTNTTLNFSIVDYADETNNLTLYYRCPASTVLEYASALLLNQSTCDSNEANTKNYYFSSDFKIVDDSYTEWIEDYFRSCGGSVKIPVWQSTIQSMASNLRRQIAANLTSSLQEGFGLQWLANNNRCQECERSNGKCGYETRTGDFTCFCPDKPYSSSCSGKGSYFNKRRKIFFGVAAGVAGIITIFSALLVFWKKNTENDSILTFWQKKTKNDQDMEAFIRNYQSLAPKRYNYSDVKKMTKSFNDKLGRGGYGEVYKGKLPDGRLVAVKILKASKGNGEEFINEVASISNTSHVNVVNFLGFCYEKKKRALIYEYLPNGSLDQFIYEQESSRINRKLTWRTIYQIAAGIARGLEYLHRGCNVRIVHFDIKPHNILLDRDFCPKISDFGLSKQSTKKESIMSMLDARGTIGYIAPEVFCRSFGGVSHKSDVYSYGMMILEMVGGRKKVDVRLSHSSEIYFPDSIYKHLEPGSDFQFDGVVTEEEKEMVKKMIIVSLWCIQTNPADRPSTNKVVEMLEGSLQNLPIPPKPTLSLPTKFAKQSSPTLSTEIASLEESYIE